MDILIRPYLLPLALLIYLGAALGTVKIHHLFAAARLATATAVLALARTAHVPATTTADIH